MGETLDVRLIDRASGMVHQDVACVTCGYNLRTLRGDANCPECFAPVIQSLRPDDLSLAAPAWLGRVQSGVTCLLVSSLGLLVVFAIVFLYVKSLGSSPAGPVAAGLTFLIYWVVCAVGVFRANAWEPSTRPEQASQGPRTAARLLALASWLGFVVIFPLGRWMGGAGLFTVLVPLILLGSFVFTLVSFRRLARRARRPGMVRLTTVLLWLMLAGWVAVAGSAAVSALVFRQVVVSRMAFTTTAPAGLGYAGGATARNLTSSAYIALPATTAGYVGPVTPAVTTTAPAMFLPRISPTLQAFSTVVTCITWPLLLACYVLGLVALFKYRAMFRTALSRNASLRYSD